MNGAQAVAQVAHPQIKSPLVAITVNHNGQVKINCNVPKLEAVKLLLNVVEELRLQAYREHDRLVQPVASGL